MNKKNTKNVVLVTGGFDPIHSGHISYFKEAKKMTNYLIVGLNSDDWLKRKKGNFFLPWKERAEILNNINFVDEVIDFNDQDNTAIDAIEKCLCIYDKVVFANGGDRQSGNVPEYDFFKKNNNVEFKYGIGGNKKLNSSSWILDEFINKNINIDKKYYDSSTQYVKKAPWGEHTVICIENFFKVKRIIVNPKKQLSLQFHNHRDEHWIIVQGKASITIDNTLISAKKNDYVFVKKNQKHRIKNISNEDLVLIEVSTGDYLEDDDIVRLDDDYSRT